MSHQRGFIGSLPIARSAQSIAASQRAASEAAQWREEQAAAAQRAEAARAASARSVAQRAAAARTAANASKVAPRSQAATPTRQAGTQRAAAADGSVTLSREEFRVVMTAVDGYLALTEPRRGRADRGTV